MNAGAVDSAARSGNLAHGSEGISKREQVADQCKAVVQMCEALAEVHGDYETLLRGAQLDALLDIVGDRTAALMEHLGNVINGMDAAEEDADAWMVPVFERAHTMFPQPDA